MPALPGVLAAPRRLLATPRGEGAAACLLLVCFAALCAHGLAWDSPTVDEFAHLPAGLYTLRTGDFSLFPLNPPLVKLVTALPLLAAGADVDTHARVENTGWYPWVFGTDFMERNRPDYDRLFLLGRLPVVGLGLLLGLVIWRWARALYGGGGGLLALFLYAFCPSLIAHAHLATVDVGLALFLLLALAAFQRLVRRGGLPAAVACGAALGLAELVKFTAVLLYPLLLVLGLLELARGRRFPLFGGGSARPAGGTTAVAWSLGALAVVFAVSLLVVDAGYLFQGVGHRAGDFRFASGALRTVFAALPRNLPVPLPAQYLVGFDALQRINEVGEFPTYFFGDLANGPEPAYFPATLLLKTPLPLLAAWLLAPFARRGRREGERLVWVPALGLLAVFCLLSQVHYGIRYVLPVVALGIVYAGRLAPHFWGEDRVENDGEKGTEAGRSARQDFAVPISLVRLAVIVLLLLYPLSALLATPNTIDYFNLLAAGQGDAFLLDSNLDWGQGLKRLAAWQRRERVRRIGLAYFGHVDPALYGIDWQPPRPGGGPEWTAVSANFLHGLPYATYRDGRIVPVPAGAFAWLAAFPDRRYLGGGIFVVRTGGPGR